MDAKLSSPEQMKNEILSLLLTEYCSAPHAYRILKEDLEARLVKLIMPLFQEGDFNFCIKASDIKKAKSFRKAELRPDNKPQNGGYIFKERFKRQTSCPSMFAGITFVIRPLDTLELRLSESLPDRVQSIDEPKTRSVMLCLSAAYLLKSILDFVQTHELLGFEIIWTEALFHLIDTQPWHFYMPPKQALSKAFVI